MSSSAQESQSSSSSGEAVTYIGSIRRSEGNVLIIFASLTLGLIVIGTCVFVALCRARRAPPQRYGRVRRCTTSALYVVAEETEMK